jgi:hypothetical protein
MVVHFNYGLFDQTPQIPDLTPKRYHLFTSIKNWLGSQRFNYNEELMECVKTWLNSQAPYFFHTDTQKLIPQYKCPNSGREYVEK